MFPRMRLHPFSTVVLLCILVFSVKCQYTYDCRRIDDCKNGGTCVENDCTCLGTFGGYDCGYDTALADACTSVPNPCLNGGTCYNDGASDLCACPYGFYGLKCENATVQIKCEGNAVEFTMVFPTEFAGTVKLGENPECATTETHDAEVNVNKYSLTVDISGNEIGCNMTNIETTTNAETGATDYTALFQVNYLPDITASQDEIYTLTCSHENAGIQLSKDFANVGVVKENLTVSDFNETYSPVEIAVLDRDGNPLTANTQLYVGDIFQLHVYLTDDLAYKDVLLESCTTNNTLENEDQKTFTILDRACPTKLSKRLTKGQEVKMYETTLPDGTIVQTNGKVVAIEAFKFVNSDNIGVVCSARVCKAGDTSCAVPTNCDEIRNQPPPTTGGTAAAPTEGTAASPDEGTAATDTTTPAAVRRRKKRAASNADEDEKIVSTILTVLEPGQHSSSKQAEPEEVNLVEKCLAKQEITAVVAVLGTAVCILLVSCFIISCLALKRREKATPLIAMPHLKVEKFHIPRAHINDSFSFGEM